MIERLKGDTQKRGVDVTHEVQDTQTQVRQNGHDTAMKSNTVSTLKDGYMCTYEQEDV